MLELPPAHLSNFPAQPIEQSFSESRSCLLTGQHDLVAANFPALRVPESAEFTCGTFVSGTPCLHMPPRLHKREP